MRNLCDFVELQWGVDTIVLFSRGRQLKFSTFTFFLRALTYLLIRLSFSLFSLFLANWTFLFSYFLPLPPSLSTPFSYLLPSVVHGDIKYRYTTCRSSRNMPQKSICHPLPKFSFPFLPASLSFLRIRKFSYCLSFSLFLTYFFLFLLISFSRFLFRSFFSFPCSQAKSAKKICSFFKKI